MVPELRGEDRRLGRDVGAVVFTQQAGGGGWRDSGGSLQVSYRF
ncbi:hypothetical protein [Pantoea ananatis]|nr:hypothetical protein [Pantoea ananatis]